MDINPKIRSAIPTACSYCYLDRVARCHDKFSFCCCILLICSVYDATIHSAYAQRCTSVQVGSPAASNLFVEGEPIIFDVSANGVQSAGWKVRDFSGVPILSGTIALADGHAVIAPQLSTFGYFEIVIQPACAAAETITNFARLRQPPFAKPSVFGVVTHFEQGWAPGLAAVLARVGINNIRDEHAWASIEAEPGRYSFPAHYLKFMQALADAQVQPLLLMSYGNPLYDKGFTPYTPKAQTAYAKYGQELLARYGHQLAALEVWNEINGTWCTGPCLEDRVGVYLGLLRAVYRQIKSLRPDTIVVGGAAAGAPTPWFEKIAARDGLSSLDVVAIHPYRSEPEGIEFDVQALRELLRAYSSQRHIPIWVTEVGFGDATEEGRRQAASFLVRSMTLLLWSGAERIYWYLLVDSPGFSLGLLREAQSPRGPYAPNPVLPAYATIMRWMNGMTMIKRVPTDQRTHAYLVSTNRGQFYVAWSADGTPVLAVKTAGATQIHDIMDNEIRYSSRADTLHLKLSGEPVFISGSVENIVETRPDQLLADSVVDFATAPGQKRNGWSYGYRIASPQSAEAGSDFTNADVLQDDWSIYWGAEQHPYLKIGREIAQPAVAGSDQIWSIRRWTASDVGPVDLRVSFRKQESGGDGADAMLVVDGKTIWQHRVPAQAARYVTRVMAEVGTTIDLVVTPGPALDGAYDGVSSSLRITRPKTG